MKWSEVKCSLTQSCNSNYHGIHNTTLRTHQKKATHQSRSLWRVLRIHGEKRSRPLQTLFLSCPWKLFTTHAKYGVTSIPFCDGYATGWTRYYCLIERACILIATFRFMEVLSYVLCLCFMFYVLRSLEILLTYNTSLNWVVRNSIKSMQRYDMPWYWRKHYVHLEYLCAASEAMFSVTARSPYTGSRS